MISTTDLVVVAATTKSPLLPGKVIDFGLLPLVLFFFIASTHMAFAEGIPELKPSNDNVRLIINRSSDAGGNRTNFAGWGNSDPFSRLYIHITDPSKECIYLGLGLSDFGGNDDLDPEFNGNAIRYRVLSPDGSTSVVDRTIPLANLNITGASDADMYNNAKNGPFEIEGAGYTAGSSFTISPAHFAAAGLSNVSGDYFIEFTEVDANGDPVNPEDDTQSGAWDGFELEFFDFTVADCANPSSPIEKIGRVWSWRWEMTTTSPNIPFMGAFYVCADDESTPAIPNDAFITKIDFENVGFTPYAFSVFFNSNGVMNTGNPVVDRRSVTGEDAMGTPEHRAFLNDPRDIAPTAQFGSPRVEVYFERCSASGPFTYCFQVNLDKVGSQIDILLDLNGSPGYQPGTADVVLSKKIEPGEQGVDICLPWDGKDGTGAPVDPDELNTNNVIPTYSEGIFHFPIFDAETNAMSFNVTYVRPIPTGASAIKLKWDDSLINDAPINDPHPGPCQKVNLEGCSVGLVSCTRCWTDFDYGDRATLNTFWTTLTKLLEFNIRSTGYYTCDITGDNELCQGDATTLSANLTLLPPGATAPSSLHYSWTGPNGPVGGNSASLNINDFDPADDAGTYTLSVFFGSECSSSCTFDLRASNNCQADLSLDKSVSDNTPDVGQTITFTLEVSNGGPIAATGVVIEDEIPNGYGNITVTDGIGVYNAGTGKITWNIASIPAPPDENVIELTYTVQVNAPTTGTSYYNVAQVTDSDQEDPDSDPDKDETEDDDGDGDPFDDDEDFEEVCPNPGISITPGPIELCMDEGLALNVINKAGGSGSCIISWFTSLDGVNFSSTGSTGDSYNVPPLETGVYYYKAEYRCDGSHCALGESNITQVNVVSCQADLSVDKSVSDNTPDVGQTITFTIEVTNSGPAEATDVAIQDEIPNGYSNITVTDGIGVYNAGTGFITWNIASIPAPPDENVIELTYTAQVNAPTNGTSYYNVAQVTDSDQEDPDSDPGKDETEDDDGDGDPFDDDEDFEEVCPNPAISITPGPVVLCIGNGTTLSVVSKAGGTGNCTVSWFVSSNGINFSPTGTTGDTYDVPSSLPEGARYYKARYECNGTYCEAAESNITEVIVVPQSSATIENFILGYDYATSGVCGNFNVLMEVEICNDGETIIANLNANVDLAAQANGVFAGNAQILGFVEDGEATYSSVFNDDFDGENNLSLFDEAVSLGVSKCVRVRISFEVAPEEAASQGEAYSAIFASTVGALPGNLPGEETSCLVGIDEDEVELGDCWYKTRIAAANDNINVTVTAECTAIITPDMILENHLPGCDSWEYPLGGFYRLRVLYPGQTEPGEPLPWVELNANDFPNGMAIIYVENVGQECLPLWGKVTLEDKRAPYFECEPEEVYTIENTYEVQTADGVLKNNDPRLNFSHYSCFQDENGSPDNCEQPYDVLEFYVSEADVYTFEAWELLGNDEVENGDELLLALYQGEFDPDQPCSNIIGQSNSVSEYGVVDPGLNPDARIRMAFPLFPGKKYSLLVAQDDCPDNHDAYRIYAFSDQDGEILNENSETSGVVEELTDHFSDPRPLRVEKELFCSDVEYILNNSDYTPNPTPLDNCDEEPETWFIDELTEMGDCGDIYITRTWYIRDAAGNQGQNCVQTIHFKRPELEDVQKPATTVPIECDELSSEWLDENGRPNPAVAGYPFVITAFGVADLKESLCNIGADYRDISVIDVCDNTQKIVRQWIILDWCDIGGQWELNNGTLNNWRQIIKVGDFSAPVLSVDGVDSVIPTNAQSCAGSLLLPDVEVSDNCSADYTIVATVYLLEDAPILDPYGEPTGETQVVTTKIFEGTAGDVVYELPLGNTYKVHYQVEDNCGNEAETEYTVTIEDKVAPIAICDDDFNISIGGNGIGRITAQDVDEGSWDNCQLKDIYVSRKLPGDDFRDAYLAEIYGITFAALELDEDVEDKDQNVDSEVWVMKSNGVEVLRKKNNMWYTWWKYDVWFLCEDGGTEVLIELLAEDIYGNTNVCWQKVALEDKVAPYCEAPEDVVIDCSELPYGFDPEDNSQLAALFGEATGIDNCGSANARQISKFINWNCNSGTIVRAFVAEDLNETVSLNTCQQTIIVNPEHSYEIRFPKDVTADCESPNPDTATWNEIGCDLLIVNVVDDPFQAVVDACYKIRRTYSIINWCEYDGESDPVIVSRDHDCDGIGGNKDVYVLRRLDGDVFFDADDDETNSAPAKNERGCNPKNPKGYWEKNAQFGEAVVSSGYWQYTQFIKITDNTPPEIEIEGAGLFCSENNQSCDALVQIPFTIADVCSGPSDITVKAFVNDQLTVVGGVYPDYSISGRFEIGVYELVIQAEDGCGQTQEVEMEFEVIDCLAPAPICINGLILELTPVEPGVDADGDGDEDKGAADVWVSDFKVSGLEDCTEPVKLSINLLGETPDPNQTSLILTCDDPDTLAVEIYAWDSADNPTAIQPDGTVGGPNYDHCVTYILLQDNMFNLCNSGPQPASISGLLTNRDDEPVEFADVNMTGGMIKSMNTNASGVYGFTELTAGVDYTITPVRNDDHRNGVNTLDLVKINKHLLGTARLQDPYQMIAADVNQSGTITAFDLIHMRKLLLGIYTEFPATRSWRFIPADYAFPDDNNPWAEDIPEVLNYNNVATLIASGDFIALKMGDINNSAKPNSQAASPRNLAGVFKLNAADQTLRPGSEYRVSFTTEELVRIQGYQFTLNFDVNALELVDMEYGLAKAEHFGLVYIDEGAITTSWNHKEGIEDERNFKNSFHLGGAELFTLVFRAKQSGRLSELLSLGSRYTQAEAYNPSDELLDVVLDFGAAAESDRADSFWLEQNAPNPWTDHTQIGFYLPEAAAVKLTIRDARGRVLKMIRSDFEAGFQQFELNKESTKLASGVLYYTLETSKFSATKKMVWLGKR